MIIYIKGKSPNVAIVLEPENQAERDQMQRLKKEADEAKVERKYNVAHTRDTLCLRLAE